MSGTVTAQRKQLGNELRHIRDAAGLSQKEAADLVMAAGGKCSQAKMTRIEAGTVSIRKADLVALLNGYGVDGDRAETLLELASSAGRRRGQWAGYRAVIPENFRMYSDLEPVAAQILGWEEGRVHGLLQSEFYMLQQFVTAGADRVHWRTEDRLERQKVLEEPPTQVPSSAELDGEGPEAPYTFIIGETALRRAPGGDAPDVMLDQTEHLLGIIDDYEHVAVHVLPFNAEIPSTPTEFTLLRFDGSIKDFAYVEHPAGGLYVDDVNDLQRFVDSYVALLGGALGRVESREFIERVSIEYGAQ